MSKIADKIAKIIAKAELTQFAAEADALMSKVVELLNEHGLSMSDVAMANREDPVGHDKAAASAWASASYKTNLYTWLARYYGCDIVYTKRGNKIVYDVIGRESARATFSLMVPFIDGQVTKAARELVNSGASATMSKATRAVGNALVFRLGRLVAEQTKKDAEVEAARGFALVPVDQVKAVKLAAFPELRVARAVPIRSTRSAREAAEGISLHRQASGEGQRRLG